MDRTPPQQTMLGYALIIGIAAIVIALRMRRMSKERPLKIDQLWIVPGIYGLIAAFLYWRFPPQGMTILWCAVGLGLGAAAGWWRGRMMQISVEPETHAIKQKASPAAMIFLLALIAVRYGAREVAALSGPVTHLDVMQATDILIHAQFTEKLKRRLNEIYVKHTGKDYETVHNALERDRFLSPEEAKDFGIIDQIFEKRAVPEGATA